MNPQEIEALTLQHLPANFLRRALKAVFLAHDVARKDCKANFADTEAENLIGYYRRAKLEGYLRDATDSFEGIFATVQKGDGSGWNHTEIHGGPIVLTQSAVQVPCGLVEKAEFRRTLAEESQLSFWPEPRPEGASLYALLLHSRSRWATREEIAKFGHLPGSVHIAFPSPTLDFYVHTVDLFERFPDVVASSVPDELDGEALVRYIRRARRAETA